MKKTVFQRIMFAYRNGQGLRLSAEDIKTLVRDSEVIKDCAEADDISERAHKLYDKEQKKASNRLDPYILNTCPVCNGTGKMEYTCTILGERTNTMPCRHCRGHGVV